MSHLYTNARWWRDGSLCNLHVSSQGKVTYRGPDEPFADDETDLEGAWLLPGFVDCHCHILPTGLDLQNLNLSNCRSREEVLHLVQAEGARLAAGDWLRANHYDQTKFLDGKHLTTQELDAVTGPRPAILTHASGHACVVNSRALQLAGLMNSSGLLLETDMDLVDEQLPITPREKMAEAILAAGKSMSSFGITSAADMQTGRYNLEDELWAYETALSLGCPLRIRLYVEWNEIFEKRPDFDWKPRDPNLLRIAGIKLFADGAIGAGTAATYEDFLTGGKGTLIYEPGELNRRVQIADEAGFMLAIHSIGDRSTDIVLDALEKTKDPSKHRIEHAMMLSDIQIERIKRLGVRLAMQPEFLTRFRHAYVKQLGEERAAGLKRFDSLSNAGVPVGFSSDRPIVPGNPWDGIMAAVNHSQHAVEYERAVESYTHVAALLDGDTEFGRLDLMQFPDFQTYAQNPKEKLQTPLHVHLGQSNAMIYTETS